MENVITHKGVKYRKVDRNVKEGDKYIVCITQDYGFFTEGRVYNVNRIDSFGDPIVTDDDGDSDIDIQSSEYDVLEPITESIDDQIAELERLLAERRAEKAREQERNRIKVGEYAVVITDESSDFEENEVVIISEDDRTNCPYKADRLDGIDYGWLLENWVRRATPEEVAEAKRQAAEVAAKLAEEKRYRAEGWRV